MIPIPKVSVIVPCFNGAPWLSAAVQSVLSQDAADLELIFADDASTDDSIATAYKAADGDPRLRVLTAATNRGMTANWNAGLAEARGDFVCKLDCDDSWRPGTLRALLGVYADLPRLTAAFCRTVQCNSKLEPTGAHRGDLAFVRRGEDPARDAVHPAHDWYEWCFDDIQIWHSNAFMVRRSILAERLGGWDSRFGCASDTDLILRLLELGGDVAHLGHVGVLYRLTPDSVSATGRRQGWVSVEGRLACALSAQRTLARGPLSPHLALQRRRYRVALHEFTSGGEYSPPARVAIGHQSLLRELQAVSLGERMSWRVRCWVSGLFRNLRGGATS